MRLRSKLLLLALLGTVLSASFFAARVVAEDAVTQNAPAEDVYAPLNSEDALPPEVLPKKDLEEIPPAMPEAAPEPSAEAPADTPADENDEAKTPPAPPPPQDITNFENEPKAETLPEEQVKDSLYVVRLQGLNKITARTSVIGIAPNQIVHFGNLEILLVKCWKSPPEEKPEAAALLQVWEKRPNELRQQLFLGWMFASSPGVAALEHAVYDLRVLDCLPPAKTQKDQ